MTQEDLEKILDAKIAEERSKMPVHEYIDLNAVQNGRGAIDAGLLFVKALDTSLAITKKAVAATLAEVLKK